MSDARERQAATAEVLRAIQSSPDDLKSVFAVILENATRLCQARFGTLYLTEGDAFRAVAMHNAPRAFAELRQREPLVKASGNTVLGRVAKMKRAVQVADMGSDPAYKNLRQERRFVTLAGVRTLVTVPMLKKKELIGVITVYRQDVRPFTKHQVELLQSFAAQAVIAIENTRLLNELRQRTADLAESLDQQTATAQVLQVISSAPGELKPVFSSMLENAVRICGASFGHLVLYDGRNFNIAALHNLPTALAGAFAAKPHLTLAPGDRLFTVLKTKRVVQIADIATEPAYARTRLRTHADVHTLLIVPMLKDNRVIGAISIYRQEIRPFTDKQISLVTNFAAQAVIAIENTRLLNQLRESLEQQTATSEVLGVISRSQGELRAVFEAVLENAVRICDAKFGNLWLRQGDRCRIAATHGAPPKYREFLDREPLIDPETNSVMARNIRDREAIQVEDLLKAPTYGSRMR
ncbi:MAG TPA: GAF domain-containing protein, partial [Xanthobacteraceae bacterium]|nr:GAF domain-containing protein [Xanthobacteraceae bacterium]